jgi:hypothetical protein
MAYTWRYIPLVEVGHPITSTQHAAVSDGTNERITSGLGDCAWRIVNSFFNLFRQVRNPANPGPAAAFPPQAEFFQIYQHIDPKYSTATWPVADPGEPEGANLANPLMQFLFGSSVLDAEAFRIVDGSGLNLWLPSGPPDGVEDLWELGKLQRGVISALDGQANTPALTAAISGMFISSPYYSPMGKTYGGFYPVPTQIDTCDLGDGYTGPSYEITFSALRENVAAYSGIGSVSTVDGKQVVTYAGSCPETSLDTAAGHVWTIVRLPWAYYVLVYDGSTGGVWERFATADWVEGPYSGGGHLARSNSGNLWRTIAEFSVAFRGTATQRAKDNFNLSDIAFDNEEFYSRQYALAPARANNSGGGIEAVYATASASGTTIADDTLLTFSTLNGGQTHYRASGFVFAGFFAKATNLARSTPIEVIDEAGKKITRFALRPDDTGAASVMVWLSDASEATALQVKLPYGAQFIGSGTITFEVAELYSYKPQFVDAYLLLRLSATLGTGAIGTVDGSGFDATNARQLWESYKNNGCIANGFVAGPRDPGPVNENPVYEAARKFSREHVKILDRQPFLSYEVNADGKSVFRFKRWAYGLFNDKADQFYNLAPSFEPVTEIIVGEEYVVRATSGSVAYAGKNYYHGERFFGLGGVPPKFTKSGDAEAFVYDGIKSVARPKGQTNEWVFFPNFHVYHWSPSSIWKTDAYGDYFTLNDRCAFYSASTPTELNAHINYTVAVQVAQRDDLTGYDTILLGEKILTPSDTFAVSPEMPSGYRYAYNFNTSGVDEDFCSSCRVYEPPNEIESCTIEPDMVNGGVNDVVVITLKDRLHYHPDAPSSFGTDSTSWNVADLQAEDYRTNDNALREYVVWRDQGTHASWKTGDSASFSNVQLLADNPYGSVIPHFFFLHLIPKPYDDGNDAQNSHDTRVTVDTFRQIEFYLRAMCEGFVDGEATLALQCVFEDNPFDFVYSSLCFQAFSGSHIGSFALRIREDNPDTFGPLPNSVMYAELYNRIASCLNLLDTVRLMMPMTLQTKKKVYYEVFEKSLTDGFIGTDCTPGGVHAGWWSGTPSAPALFSEETEWTSTGSFAVNSVANFVSSSGVEMCADGTGPEWNFQVQRETIQFRYGFEDDLYENAFPPIVADLTGTFNFAIVGTMTASREWDEVYEVSSEAEAIDCGTDPTTPFWDGASGVNFYTHFEEASECAYFRSGFADSGTPPGGDFMIGQVIGGVAPTERCVNSSLASLTFAPNGPTGMPLLYVPLV